MKESSKSAVKEPRSLFRTLGPVSDLEKHLPSDWWKKLFNSVYLKTDGDVVENPKNTSSDIDLLINSASLQKHERLLDLCCGQGRHSIELAQRGFTNITGVDRSRYLIRLAKKRSRQLNLPITFFEGDARQIRTPDSSFDAVFLMGNSFGYFEREEDDILLLEEVKRILGSKGKLALDVVDGQWMKKSFEPRSWEWIDQKHLVCRERSLSQDGSRIVTREVVINAEMGVIVDQFYAERLYTFENLSALLDRLGFSKISSHGNVLALSDRGQDLGMMANRLFITAITPNKASSAPAITSGKTFKVTVLLGDHRLPDTVKKGGQFNQEDLQTIEMLKKSLKELKNFQFSYIDNHKTMLKNLLEDRPDFVFNLCDEGFNNKASLELHVPAFLDMLKIPYSGSHPTALALCYNKSIVRSIAASLEIPTPCETYIAPDDQIVSLPSTLPALIKPNFGDGSIGITKNAVVKNTDELINYVSELREKIPGTPILIQEFLSGTEYGVAIIGNQERLQILPILEVDYNSLPNDLPKIQAYESKWDPASPYWTDIKYKKAELDEDTKRKLIDYSLALFEKLECRDYARFDFRKDSFGNIKLLEVNPNPGWCWDGKLNLMASFKGLSYTELLNLILQAASDRIFKTSPQGSK